MSAVLLLWQFDRSFLNGSVRERLWLVFLSGRNRQRVDGAAVAALSVVADSNLHAAQLTHQIEGTCEHSRIGIVASFVGDDVRAKHALKTLRCIPSDVLWPVISKQWDEEAHNDYGAHYFFMRLMGSRSDWSHQALSCIDETLKTAAINMRPQFQKSRSAAIYSMAQLNPSRFLELIPMFLADQYLPPWDCRYAVILALELISNRVTQLEANDLLKQFADDGDCFVQAKLSSMQLT